MKRAEDAQTVQILLVDDNELDARTMMRAGDQLSFLNEIDHVTSGEAALEYLEACVQTGTLPDLMVLDLDLPGIDGLDVLRALSSEMQTRQIPVVMMTTSAFSADIAYAHGAAAYVTKPVGLEGWDELVQNIDEFWFSRGRDRN